MKIMIFMYYLCNIVVHCSQSLYALQEAVQQYYAVHQITIRGPNCPKPILTFQEACFPGVYTSSVAILACIPSYL